MGRTLMYAESGDNFYTAVKKVQDSLKNQNDYCDLEFNEISVRVSKDSNINDLATIYDLKHCIRRLKAGYNS
jgi:hypothetical protein